MEATHHSAPKSGWPGHARCPTGDWRPTSVREDPELFTLFEEELGGCRPDRLAAVSEPQGSLPRGARTPSATLLCVPRLNNGSVAVVDCSVVAFLEEKEEEEKRMDRLEDLVLTGAHVSAADRAAWRRWAANPPSLSGGRRKKRKRRKKKLPKTSSARSSSPMVRRHSSWLWTSLCSCSGVRGGLFGALLGLTVDTCTATALGCFWTYFIHFLRAALPGSVRATLGSIVDTCIASVSLVSWNNFHFNVLVTSYPEVVAIPVEIPQVQFLDKVYMPVVVAVSGADGHTAQKTCGEAAGAVLGQGVHARCCCCVWCRWPDSADNCGDSTGAVLDKVYMSVVIGLVPMARQCRKLWRCRSFSFETS